MNWDLYWNTSKTTRFERLIQSAKEKWGYKKLLRSVKLDKPGKSLEIGCGDARLSQLLRAEGWHTTGLDFLDLTPPVDKFIMGDIFALPFGDKEFDLCISCGLLEHFNDEDVEKILQEQHRVSKRVINWYPIKSLWWSLFHKLRCAFGAKMPHNANIPKFYKVGRVSFFGLFDYGVYDVVSFTLVLH